MSVYGGPHACDGHELLAVWEATVREDGQLRLWPQGGLEHLEAHAKVIEAALVEHCVAAAVSRCMLALGVAKVECDAQVYVSVGENGKHWTELVRCPQQLTERRHAKVYLQSAGPSRHSIFHVLSVGPCACVDATESAPELGTYEGASLEWRRRASWLPASVGGCHSPSASAVARRRQV